MKARVSIVIPIFNEAKNIPILYQRLSKELKTLRIPYEILFVDDAGWDESLKNIKLLRKRDKRVKYIHFSRNFGHMAALNAGLFHSRGDFVVLMDGDLQDPPELIHKMYKKMKDGYDVVYGVKTKRKEKLLRKVLFKLFYLILERISSYKMPLDAGTFSMINKNVANVLKNLPERNKYFSGLRSWVGFRQTGIVYERGRRKFGKEASLKNLFKLALDGFVSFSYIPLRIASFFGFGLAGLSFITAIIVIILRVFFGWGLLGWASILTSVLFIGGIQLITLGIIGEYLARIYDQVKNRPEYIISEKSGV